MNFWYEIRSCHLFFCSFYFDPLFFKSIFFFKKKQLDTNLSSKEFNYAKKKKKKNKS
jgi:hypothetical protein